MHDPKSLADLKNMRSTVDNINLVNKNKLSKLDKIAMWITKNVGTMGFFIIIFIWTVFWISWNSLSPIQYRFDPYPAFVLWLFISNMIQIFLMPLIMIGQNIQGNYSELRAEADYQIDTKAEREIEAILMHLENQNEIILKILEKLEKEIEKEDRPPLL